MGDYLDPGNEELLRDFFSEAYSQVEVIEQNVLSMEQNPEDDNVIDEIFRAAHTLKGSSATVQMDELSHFTHIVEDVFDEIRNGRLKVNDDIIDAIFKSLDIIKAMVEKRDNEGVAYTEDISETENALKKFIGDDKPKKEVKSEKVQDVQTKTIQIDKVLDDISDLKTEGNQVVYRISVLFDENNPMNTVGGIQVYAALKNLGDLAKSIPAFEELYGDNFFEIVHYYLIAEDLNTDQLKITASIPEVTLDVKVDVLGDKEESVPVETKKEEDKNEITDPKKAEDEKKKPAPAQQQHKKDQNAILKVDSSRIDQLLNLVSEIVINKATFNQVNTEFTDSTIALQEVQKTYSGVFKDFAVFISEIESYVSNIDTSRGEEIRKTKKLLEEKIAQSANIFKSFQGDMKSTITKFRNTAQNLSRITSELQEDVMKIRMIPIGSVFQPFQRIVRDLSKQLNKKVNFIMTGEETELDKSVAEDLKDPLMHCVRNSMDHGIETPDKRTEKGKDPVGTLELKASNEGNMVLIEIKDDGAGINSAAIKKKAIEKKVITEDKVLSDDEVYELMFSAGFSTAEKITNVSGRGVGLDVVRSNIEKLKGSIMISSEFGSGSSFIIRLPLTLAIIQGLIVHIDTEVYFLNDNKEMEKNKVSEMYVIPITSVVDSYRIKKSDIKLVGKYETVTIRNKAISVLDLHKLFKIPSIKEDEYCYVVIVSDRERKVGLIVDSLIGEEDVVIKPLKDNPHITVPGIAGANITGDGRVSLIIDVPQIIQYGINEKKLEYSNIMEK